MKLSSLTRAAVYEWHQARAQSPAKLRSKVESKSNERFPSTDAARRSRRSTANRDLTTLKAALNRYAENHAGLPVHAWREVKPFKGVETAKLRYLSDDEARRLVAACQAEFRPMVQAALLTGARYSELTQLRVRDVDLISGTLWFPQTKSGKARPIYLEDEGAKLLESAVADKPEGALVFPRPDGKPWGPSQQARFLERASAKGHIIPAAGFHDRRRTYGARLAMRSVPMAVIAAAMGHADERITRRHYVHLEPTYVADLIRKEAAGLGIVGGTDGAKKSP